MIKRPPASKTKNFNSHKKPPKEQAKEMHLCEKCVLSFGSQKRKEAMKSEWVGAHCTALLLFVMAMEGEGNGEETSQRSSFCLR